LLFSDYELSIINSVFHQHFDSDEVIHFWEKIKKITYLQDQYHLDLFEDKRLASEFSSRLIIYSNVIHCVYSYVRHINFNHSVVLFKLLIDLCEQRPISKRIFDKVKFYLTGRRSFTDFNKFHNFLVNIFIEIVFEEIEVNFNVLEHFKSFDRLKLSFCPRQKTQH
jgi:hypothetical protein